MVIWEELSMQVLVWWRHNQGRGCGGDGNGMGWWCGSSGGAAGGEFRLGWVGEVGRVVSVITASDVVVEV